MALSNQTMGFPHADLNALAAFAEGRLPDDERQVLTSHLASCTECRATLAAMARGSIGRGPRARMPAWLPIAAALVLATTVVVWRVDRSAPIKPAPASAARGVGLPAAPPDSSSPPATATPAPELPTPPRDSSDLSVRRGAERRVGDKTFHLVAGEWIDSAYDPLALLPVRDVVGSDERSSVIARNPALAKFDALGPKVIVVNHNVVYRFRP